MVTLTFYLEQKIQRGVIELEMALCTTVTLACARPPWVGHSLEVTSRSSQLTMKHIKFRTHVDSKAIRNVNITP